jgi:hypothetical protein
MRDFCQPSHPHQETHVNHSSDNNGFGKFVPGFEFLQNLIQPGGGKPGMEAGPMAGLGSWVAPTLNVEDLDKRIEELKAVHFWLDQNAKALGATVQALEVQRMTLATLRDLNVNMGDVAKASGWGAKAAPDATKMSDMFAGFAMPPSASAPPPPAPAPAPRPVEPVAPEPVEEPEAPEAPEASGSPVGPGDGAGDKSKKAAAPVNEVDPMQWWGALQQQFQNIAVSTMNDLAKQGVPPMGAGSQATAKTKTKAASRPASKGKAASKASAKAPAKTPAPAKKKASPVGKAAAKKSGAAAARAKPKPRA